MELAHPLQTLTVGASLKVKTDGVRVVVTSGKTQLVFEVRRQEWECQCLRF